MTTFENARAQQRAGGSVLAVLLVLAVAAWARLRAVPWYSVVGLAFVCAAAWTRGIFWGCLVTGIAVLLLEFRNDRSE